MIKNIFEILDALAYIGCLFLLAVTALVKHWTDTNQIEFRSV